jgi:hypothetical protein
MKRLLLSAALVGALVAPSFAQVNVVPQTGVTFGYVPKATYSAAFFGLVPAASATDVVCLSGSATKTIKIQKIVLTGSAGTAVNVPINILRRTALDSGGTEGATTANPANTIAKRLTTSATASAVPISYTANPTLNDTSPTYLDSGVLSLPLTSTAGLTTPLVFDYTRDNVNLMQPPTILAGVTGQICANFTEVTVSSGVVNGVLVWTEE